MEYSDDQSRVFWSEHEARTKIEKYCAYQERCHREVRSKLAEHGIYGDLLEEILSELIQNDFLNEERFATSFARGKFRIKKWGRNKIKQELTLRHVTEYCIRSAMAEIDDEEYMDTLRNLLHHKIQSTTFKNEWDKRKKLTDYALRKGYEYDIVTEILKAI
jgi:regulatory protein